MADPESPAHATRAKSRPGKLPKLPSSMITPKDLIANQLDVQESFVFYLAYLARKWSRSTNPSWLQTSAKRDGLDHGDSTTMLTRPVDSRIQKRPLHHPPVPSSRASSSTQKIIYVSSKTPFMSAVQRIRTHLTQISKRKSQSINDTTHSSTSKGAQIRRKAGGDRILAQAMEEIERAENSNGGGEEVIVKGTGKAIEKVMGIAGFFQENAATEGVIVRLTTGSVWAIDDISVSNEEIPEGEQMDVDGKEEEDIPETRVRQVSVLEVRIALR